MSDTPETPTGPEGHGTPPRKARRWPRVLLVLSLCLNLLLIGLFAGLVLRGAPGPGGFGVPVEGFRSIVGAMPEADRDAVRASLRARGPELRRIRQDMRAIRTEFLALLRAEDFSEDALTALFARQADTLRSVGQGAQEILIARISAMAPADRAALADRLEKEMKSGRRKDRDRDRSRDR